MFGDDAYVFVSEKIIDSVGFSSNLEKDSKCVKLEECWFLRKIEIWNNMRRYMAIMNRLIQAFCIDT